MENFNNGSGQKFWLGAFVGWITSGSFLFPANVGAVLWLTIIIKLLSTGIIAMISGMCTMLVTDFYNYKMKERIKKLFKNKKNGNHKPEDENRAA